MQQPARHASIRQALGCFVDSSLRDTAADGSVFQSHLQMAFDDLLFAMLAA